MQKINKWQLVFSLLFGPTLFFSFMFVANLIEIPLSLQTSFVVVSEPNSELHENCYFLTVLVNSEIKPRLKISTLSIFVAKSQKYLKLSNLNWFNSHYLIIAENENESFEYPVDSLVVIYYERQKLWNFIVNNIFC